MEEKFIHINNNYLVRILNKTEEQIVQQLCEKCTDYYEIVEDRLPQKDAAHEILNDLPQNKDYNDKFVFGCFDGNNTLIAVIDFIKDYPDKREWIIGLLMIDPKERGSGLGKLLHEYMKTFALSNGAVKLRIGVAEDNKNAFSFWSSLGYQEVKRVNMEIGNKNNIIIVMNLPIE